MQASSNEHEPHPFAKISLEALSHAYARSLQQRVCVLDILMSLVFQPISLVGKYHFEWMPRGISNNMVTGQLASFFSPCGGTMADLGINRRMLRSRKAVPNLLHWPWEILLIYILGQDRYQEGRGGGRSNHRRSLPHTSNPVIAKHGEIFKVKKSHFSIRSDSGACLIEERLSGPEDKHRAQHSKESYLCAWFQGGSLRLSAAVVRISQSHPPVTDSETWVD
ncbi:hypothetical protein BDW66DRAFT_100511 [Aspergillus desertorum]